MPTNMVPQPSRTLDLQRKEELILQKQIRQSTAKIKQNLPTLIEASPDFNSKKLPYLPYLPDSVQYQQQYPFDDTNESVTTDDLPSLYSVPHKLRSESRCSSITFDLTDAEGFNRNRSKSRKRQKDKKNEKEESQANIFAREDEETIERARPQTEVAQFVKEEDDILSRWSCRKCTLENPLQEAVCVACGGSRLSSIGDIEVPRIVEPKNLVNLIKDDTDDSTIADDVPEGNINVEMKWKCKICTLENEPFNFYCDACNSPNPRKEGVTNGVEEAVPADKMKNEDMWIMVNKIVRYVGIGCFCLILLCALFNMLLSIINLLQTFLPARVTDSGETLREKLDRGSVVTNDEAPTVTNIREAISIEDTTQDKSEKNAAADINFGEKREDIEKVANDAEQDVDNTAIVVDEMYSDNLLGSQIFFDIFGLLPILFVIYWPLFLYLATKLCKMSSTEKITPRVAQPM